MKRKDYSKTRGRWQLLICSAVFFGMAATFPIKNGVLNSALDANSQNITTVGTFDAASVTVGDGAGTLSGKVEIGGTADQPQLVIEGHSTQTDDIFIIQNDADAEVFSVSVSGDVTVLDDAWVGIGASAARVEFDNTTIDLVELLGANVRVGAITPDTASAVSDLAVFGTIEAQGSGGIIAFSEAGTPTFTLDRDGSDTWSMRNVSGVFHIYNSTDAGSRLSIDAGDGDVTIVNDLEVDLIREKTGDAGVTIDSVVLKDNIVDATVVKGAPQNWAWMYRNAGLTHETDGGYEELDWDTVLEDASSIVDLTDNDWSYTYTGIATLTCYIELSATLQNSTQYMALKINDVTGSRRIFAKRKMLGNVSHALNGTIQFRVDDVARTYKLEYWQNDSTSEAYVVGSNKCYCTTYILPD